MGTATTTYKERTMTMTASIYDPETGGELTTGLQGSRVCNEAIRCAEQMADQMGREVHLVDDDGEWLVHPRAQDGTREAADPINQCERE